MNLHIPFIVAIIKNIDIYEGALMNSHITIKKHSMIVEALGVIHACVSPYAKEDMIPDDLREKVCGSNVAKYLQVETESIFVMFELLLDIKERCSLDVFISSYKMLSKTHLQKYLLRGYFSQETVSEASDNEQALRELAMKISVKNLDVYMEHLLDPKPFFEEIILLTQWIYNHSSFKNMFTDQVVEDISQKYKLVDEALAKRHPLSFSQSLMGKSFYNIADWEVYEFLYVYTLYPYKLRVMDERSNIMLITLYDRQWNNEEKLDSIKRRMKILADPNRMAILRMIYGNPMFGKEIAKSLSLTTATVSHHLDLMRKEYLIHEERKKNTKYFSTNQQAFDKLMYDISNYIKKNKTF